jgi:hypothetical protein
VSYTTCKREKRNTQHVLTLHRDCDYNSMISFLVGVEEKLFTVHKDLICASSKFFKAACSQRWAEGKEKEVRLPEVLPQDFQRYLAWLYSKQLQTASKDGQAVVWDATVDMYILGDVLDDMRLRNAAIGLLFALDYSVTLPGYSQIQRLWRQTPDTSFLRELCVEKFVIHVQSGSFVKMIDEFPEEFVREIAVAGLRYRDDNRGFGSKLEAFLELVPDDD